MLSWYCAPTRRQRCTSPGRMSMVGRRWPLIARKRVAVSGKSVPKSSTMPKASNTTRVVELMRMRGVAGQHIPVGREVVGESDLQGFARLHAQRRDQPAFVAAQVEAHAADVAIGVAAAQAGAEPYRTAIGAVVAPRRIA